MDKLLISLMMTGIAVTDLQAAWQDEKPVLKEGGYNQCSQFMMISGCVEYFDNCARFEETEINFTAARSFYPANSLNVLKKAFYAFEAPHSNIPHYSEAG